MKAAEVKSTKRQLARGKASVTGFAGTRMYLDLMREGGLSAAYGGLSRPRKRYVAELVKRFGCKVRVAIEHTWGFPYDEWIYDYRTGRAVHVHVNKRTGRIGKPYEF